MIRRSLGALGAAAFAVLALGAAPASANATLPSTPAPPVCRVLTLGPVAELVAVEPGVLNNPSIMDKLTPCDNVISLKKSVSNATPKLGDTIQWTVTAKNASVIKLPDITVTDVLPSPGSELLFSTSASTNGNPYSLGTGKWDAGSLAPSASATLFINEIVNGTDSQQNCADASATLPLIKDVGKSDVLIPNDQLLSMVPVTLAQACATETPVVPTPAPTNSPSSTPTPTPVTTANPVATTSTSVALPNTGRRA